MYKNLRQWNVLIKINFVFSNSYTYTIKTNGLQMHLHCYMHNNKQSILKFLRDSNPHAQP